MPCTRTQVGGASPADRRFPSHDTWKHRFVFPRFQASHFRLHHVLHLIEGCLLSKGKDHWTVPD